MSYVDLRLDKDEALELQSILEGRTESTAIVLHHAIGIQLSRLWDENRDQLKPCSAEDCGHAYERHFDSWDNMRPVGCKYCPCFEFED